MKSFLSPVILPAGKTSEGPLVLQSGPLRTSPAAGRMEFLTDKAFFTQTTGPTRREVKLCDQHYGEMWQYENAVSMAIDTANIYHAIRNFSAGYLSGFSFVAGLVRTISSTGNYGGTVAGTVRFNCSAAHNLTTGDWVTITGTTNYNGLYQITTINTTAFYATATWVSSQAGFVQRGDYLLAGADCAGMYMAQVSVTARPTSPTVQIKFDLNVNGSAYDNVSALARLTSSTGYNSMSAGGILPIVAGDRVWISLKNITGNTDLTVTHGNICLSRM